MAKISVYLHQVSDICQNETYTYGIYCCFCYQLDVSEVTVEKSVSWSQNRPSSKCPENSTPDTYETEDGNVKLSPLGRYQVGTGLTGHVKLTQLGRYQVGTGFTGHIKLSPLGRYQVGTGLTTCIT